MTQPMKHQTKTATMCAPDSARTIVYRRVSTDDQATADRASFPEQERQCRAYAADLNRTVDYLWDDEGVSGRDESRLERLASWSEKHRRSDSARGLIIALKRDRWERFVHDDNASAFFEYRMRRAGWDVAFALERKSGNKTADAVTATLHKRMAAEESEEKGRRARVGMLAQAKAKHWQGRPPFGYDRLAVNVTTNRTRTLEPYERSADGERVMLTPGAVQDQRTVAKMFAWAAAGVSCEDIARRLNAGKVPGPWTRYPNNWRSGREDKCWMFHNTKAILLNPAYVGELRFVSKGTDDVIVVGDAWPALVKRSVWEQVQTFFEQRPRPRPGTGRYLLSGLLACSCGAAFVGGGGQRPNASDPERTIFYRCLRCRHPAVTVNKRFVEGQVIKLATKHVQQVLRDGSFDRMLDEVIGERRGQHRDTQKDLERARTAARQERDRLVQAVAKGLIKDEEAKGLLEAARERITQLDAEGHQSRFQEQGVTVGAKERVRLKALARDFGGRIAKADIGTARDLLRHWVQGIELDGRKRTGKIVLRRVPIPGLDNQTEGDRS